MWTSVYRLFYAIMQEKCEVSGYTWFTGRVYHRSWVYIPKQPSV